MVSVLHKEVEYKGEKLKKRRLEVMQPRIRIKSELPVVNNSPLISPHEVFAVGLINIVHHLFLKNNQGKGGGLITKGAY